MAKQKIGNRWYTLHDVDLTKKEANKQITFLKKNTKYKYFRKVKHTQGYWVYKGT